MDSEKQTIAFQRLNTCIGPDTEYGIKTLDLHEPKGMGWRTEEEAREAHEQRRRKRDEFDRVMTARMGTLTSSDLDRLWETYTTSGTKIGQGQSVHSRDRDPELIVVGGALGREVVVGGVRGKVAARVLASRTGLLFMV